MGLDPRSRNVMTNIFIVMDNILNNFSNSHTNQQYKPPLVKLDPILIRYLSRTNTFTLRRDSLGVTNGVGSSLGIYHTTLQTPIYSWWHADTKVLGEKTDQLIHLAKTSSGGNVPINGGKKPVWTPLLATR